MARRAWRFGWLGLAALVVLAVGGAVLLARFDPNSLKPRIVAAVKQATGRDLALNGPIGLRLSPWPTVELRGVALANPPGYARPEMATLDRLDLRLAVLPLLRKRFEIARLILVQPNILLELDSQGRPNWRFTPAPAPAPGTAPPTGGHTSTGAKTSAEISLHEVQIEDATLAWRDDRTGRTDALAVQQLTAKAAAPGAPLQLLADASYDGVTFRLSGQVGPFARLRQPDAGTRLSAQPAAPMPVDITLQAANASLTVTGAIAHPETLSGADFALDATIPDLGTLSPLARRRLPAVTQIAFHGHLTDAPGGFLHGAALHDVKLTTADGDLSGDIVLESGPVPALTGKLHADRIDADALLAEAAGPVTNPTPIAGGASLPAAPPPPPPKPPPAGAARLFPDTPIPFGLLCQANADLALSVGDLKTGGTDYRATDLHVVLQDGRLRVAPLSAELPDGRLDASLSVDATAPAPLIAVTLHVPGLEVAPLLAAASLPGHTSGKLEVDAELHGAGDTPHAIAAGLDGRIGLAMQNGIIDAQLLNRLLGPVLQGANLPGLLSHGGSGDLRCFALRADAQSGVAELRTLVLNSSMLSMDGSGSANLGEETLALQLRPQGRVGGTAITVALRVAGPMRSPNVAVNGLGTAESNVGTAAGAVIGSATPLGWLGGMLGGSKLLGGASGDSCAGPLALARGQAAPAAAAPGTATQAKPTDPGTLLHDLLH